MLALDVAPHTGEIIKMNTLLSETFTGRKFRGFAVFSQKETFFARENRKKRSCLNQLLESMKNFQSPMRILRKWSDIYFVEI